MARRSRKGVLGHTKKLGKKGQATGARKRKAAFFRKARKKGATFP